jgi:diguanylate cyclase (GGDEF)-like protein/PAS domain S-box-containing protein
VTIRDRTGWIWAPETVFLEKEQAFGLLASIADAIIATDLTEAITYMNPTAERLTGWRPGEALRQPLSTVLPLVFEATRQPVDSIAAWCLHESRPVDLAHGVLLLRRDGTEVPIEDSAAPLRDRDGKTIGVVLVFRDVTETRRETRRLSHDAMHDSLTGLISRREFERRLTRVLESASGTSRHVLCYLDLDRFKSVNDTCGHEAGDHLLRTIGGLLVGRLRGRDTVGRLGGDEFGIILENCAVEMAKDIAADLVSAIEDLRYVWKERSLSLGASIGLVPITAAHGRAAADVLRSADRACYAAKNAGGNRVHLAPGPSDEAARQPLETRRMGI